MREQNSAWRLFRGLQHHRARRARQPAMNEIPQPGALGQVMMAPTSSEMKMARMRARLVHADATARSPAMHHRVRHVGMELEAERVAGLERLHRESHRPRQAVQRRRATENPRRASDRRAGASPGRARIRRRSDGSGNNRLPPGLLGAGRPAHPIVSPASAHRGRCPETAGSRAGEFRSSRSRGERNRRGRWRSSGRRRRQHRRADRASPAGHRQIADVGCREGGPAHAAHCRRGPVSTFPGEERSGPAANWPGQARVWYRRPGRAGCCRHSCSTGTTSALLRHLEAGPYLSEY